jgi:hypothetical protein
MGATSQIGTQISITKKLPQIGLRSREEQGNN